MLLDIIDYNEEKERNILTLDSGPRAPRTHLVDVAADGPGGGFTAGARSWLGLPWWFLLAGLPRWVRSWGRGSTWWAIKTRAESRPSKSGRGRVSTAPMTPRHSPVPRASHRPGREAAAGWAGARMGHAATARTTAGGPSAAAGGEGRVAEAGLGARAHRAMGWAAMGPQAEWWGAREGEGKEGSAAVSGHTAGAPLVRTRSHRPRWSLSERCPTPRSPARDTIVRGAPVHGARGRCRRSPAAIPRATSAPERTAGFWDLRGGGW